jgi:hypothetical protein
LPLVLISDKVPAIMQVVSFAKMSGSLDSVDGREWEDPTLSYCIHEFCAMRSQGSFFTHH